MKRLPSSLLFGILLTAFSARPATIFAATPPSFPACANPSGTIVSSVPSGNFGIAGQSGVVSGSDTVYRISDDTLTQCFCPLDGNGIQTDWWKVTGLPANEINELIALGWILIPDGSTWGLTADPYLAKNANYGCGSVNGSSTTSSGNNGSNDGSNNTSGQVLGTVTGSILGLASTGNLQLTLMLFVLGISSFAVGGYILRK